MRKTPPEPAAIKAIYARSQRILLLNPTRYLGNLLMAGGLIQDFVRVNQQNGKETLIVLDEAFRELTDGALPAASLLHYPRRRIKAAGPLRGLHLYLKCLGQIRRFKADLAFNIEEDAASHHLTQFSGAAFKLGCSPRRHRWGYHHVLPISFSQRPKGREHRWFSYWEVFAAICQPHPQPSYLRIKLKKNDERLARRLRAWGLSQSKPKIILHAGATKDYKKWPWSNYAKLALLLARAHCQVLLIGAGEADRKVNGDIMSALDGQANPDAVIDLHGRLSLAELAVLFTQAAAMAGNDSGPFHLSSALKVPGCVIFGPTDLAVWQPLGEQSRVIQGLDPCDPGCTRRRCLHEHRCLKSITPELVFRKILEIINR